MSVFLNSTPQEDGHPLTGGAALVGGTGTYFVFEYSIVAYRDAPQYLELTSGGQFVGVWDAFGTYLEAGDTGFTFRWKFWARGAGTVALTQDTDPGWSTSSLPSSSIGNLVVSAGDWTEYNVTASPIVLADFLDFDGIRLGLNLTSGAVDITTIQLECVPDGDPIGWWASQPGEFTTGLTAEAHSAGDTAFGEFTSLGRAGAWGAAIGAAGDPTDEDDPAVLGLVDQGTAITTGAPSWARSNAVFGTDPQEYYSVMNFGANKTWVHAAATLPTPVGDEGTDYIRVPEWTVYDGPKAYVRHITNHELLPDGHVEFETPEAVITADLTLAFGEYLLTDSRVHLTIVEETPHENTDLIDWSVGTTLGPFAVVTAGSDPSETIGISLPPSGAFAIYAISGKAAGYFPVLPGDDDVATYLNVGLRIQSGVDGELRYTEFRHTYSVWDPFATPPGGQLKLRMPDNTWRILGNHGDTGGRWKFESPDLTVWKEYRTVDGAVVTHPVKLYTADGWVNVVDMTPD